MRRILLVIALCSPLWGSVPAREVSAECVCCREYLTDDLKNGRLLRLNDLQGVELYYNAAITPWFHLTADLQFVEPSLVTRDTAVVLGLRAKIDI